LTDLATAFPATVTYPYPSNSPRSFTHSSQTYSSCNTQQTSNQPENRSRLENSNFPVPGKA